MHSISHLGGDKSKTHATDYNPKVQERLKLPKTFKYYFNHH